MFTSLRVVSHLVFITRHDVLTTMLNKMNMSTQATRWMLKYNIKCIVWSISWVKPQLQFLYENPALHTFGSMSQPGGDVKGTIQETCRRNNEGHLLYSSHHRRQTRGCRDPFWAYSPRCLIHGNSWNDTQIIFHLTSHYDFWGVFRLMIQPLDQ